MRSKFKSRWLVPAIALPLIVSIAQVYTGIGIGQPSLGSVDNPIERAKNLTAVLTTKSNQLISVNGLPVMNGATILSGATLETADEATITIGSLGVLKMAANTESVLDFGSDNHIKATLIHGCITLLAKQSSAEIVTSKGVAASASANQNEHLDVCFQPGDTKPTISKVESVGVEPDAASVNVAPAPKTNGGIGQTTGVIIGAIGEGALITAVLVVPCQRGRNPSPGVPRGPNDCR